MDVVQENKPGTEVGEGARTLSQRVALAGESRYRVLFESLPDAWFLGDAATGMVLDANPAACRLIGRTREEICTLHQSQLHPPEELEKGREAFARHLQLGDMVIDDIHVLHRDGRRIPVSITAACFNDGNGQRRIFGIFKDMTQVRAAEAVRRTTRLRLEAMLELHQMAGRPYREIVDFALDRAVAITQSQIGCIASLVEPGPQLRIDAWSSEVMAKCAMRDQAIVMDVAKSQVLGEAVRQRRALIRNEAIAGQRLPEGHVGMLRHMAVPVVDDGAVVLMCCVANKAEAYDEDDVRELTLLLNALWDLLSRKRTEEALRESEAKFRSLYDAMSEIVALHEVVRNEAGQAVDYRILDCNPAFESVIGIRRSRAVGMLGSELYGAGEPPYLKEYVRVAETGIPQAFEVYYAPVQRHLHISVVSPSAGRFATITTDITSRKIAEAAAAKAREEAEAANRTKDQFLAALSHELRTPLTPVLALLSALDSDGRLPEEVRADMAMMRRNIQLEARLIDDLLDLTLIARGRLHLEQEQVDVHNTINRALEIVRRDLESKGLDIRTSLAATVRHVKGDPTRLKQVFWNVLANAARFTPVGGSITIATRNDPDGRIIIKISDTGVGIDPAFLPRIFDAFEQGPNQEHSARRGLGLGMAIARSVVMAHHGEIAAASDGPGKGACFTVTLPATVSTLPESETVAVPPAGARACAGACAGAGGRSGRPLRILLVEDHAATIAVLKRLITKMGHAVTTAGSLSEAQERAQAGEFDLLMSDIGLPDGSGMDLPRLLGDHCPPRAMAVSGYGMEADLRKSRECGFHMHLVKPIEMKKLREAIDRLGAEIEPAVQAVGAAG